MNGPVRGPVRAPVDTGDISPRRYFATVAVVLGLLFGFIAGDGSSGGQRLASLAQWQLQSIVPMALLLASHIAWSRIRAFETLGPWLRLSLSGISGSLLFTPLALLIDQWFAPGEEVFSLQELAGEFVGLAPPVTLAWLAINAPFVLGFRLRAVGAQAPEITHRERVVAAPAELHGGPSADPPAPFLALVPPALRGELLYLQAELHYLAVVTTRGRALVLYNLRDAADELPGWQGLLTHRSYWVALDRVRAFRRRGRQGALTMENGDTVPVSRRRVPAVEAALSATRSDTAR